MGPAAKELNNSKITTNDTYIVCRDFKLSNTVFRLATPFGGLLVYVYQGSYAEAASQLRGCLQAIGRPLPTTKLDLFASLFWNVVRQVLHRIGFGPWIEIKAGKLWRTVSSQDIKLSARDSAVVYQKLLQLHLTGKNI